jgi:hypothetical protein
MNQEAAIPATDQQEKIQPTDVQLTCAIILNFYKQSDCQYLAPLEILEQLSPLYEVTEERIIKILDDLCEGWLCIKMQVVHNDQGNVIKTKYTWAIRTDKETGIFQVG